MVSYYHDSILIDDDLANYDNDFDIVQDDDFISASLALIIFISGASWNT